jgi:hypothetical protein
MARVIGVEKDLLGGQDSLHATEFADLQSINKILSISSEIQKRCKSRSQLHEINSRLEVLISRRKELETLEKTRQRKRKQDTTTEEIKTLRKKARFQAEL